MDDRCGTAVAGRERYRDLLALLNPQRLHLRATWLFTRADVVANIGLIVAGMLAFWFESPHPDFVIGTLIRVYVIKEAIAILGDARRARTQTQPR